jgi:hypothetical protein
MTIKWFVRDKRLNEAKRAVFELYRNLDNGFEYHQATIEINGEASGGIKVLLGSLTPAGKERAWDAIRAYELPN